MLFIILLLAGYKYIHISCCRPLCGWDQSVQCWQISSVSMTLWFFFWFKIKQDPKSIQCLFISIQFPFPLFSHLPLVLWLSAVYIIRHLYTVGWWDLCHTWPSIVCAVSRIETMAVILVTLFSQVLTPRKKLSLQTACHSSLQGPL